MQKERERKEDQLELLEMSREAQSAQKSTVQVVQCQEDFSEMQIGMLSIRLRQWQIESTDWKVARAEEVCD